MEEVPAVQEAQHEPLLLLEAPAAGQEQEQHELVLLEAAAAAVRPEPPHELVRQLQFAPGFHFVPTEEQLVDVYLRGKIEGQGEPPIHIVNEVNILDWQPGSLVEAYKGYGEHKWYFFTAREPSSSNKKEEPNRKVRVPGVKATWKATGSVVAIVAKGRHGQEGDGDEDEEPAADDEKKVVVGTKRVLIYHSSDPEEHGKWSMHEYILAGNGKIGQYALCSIQRKQHSDTVDAGEGTSKTNRRRKRSKKDTDDADPGKTKKRRTGKKKAASTQPEEQQETAPIEAPQEPKPRTRRAATKRKTKASAQSEKGQQQQNKKETAPVSPAESPLTPPKQAPPQALQQEQRSPVACGAPVLPAAPPKQQEQMASEMYSVPVLPAAPLQGYPLHPDGMLGASAPTHEEDTLGLSFQGNDLSRCMEDLSNLLRFGDQQEQQLQGDDDVITDSDAQFQLYQQQADYDSFAVHNQHQYTEQQQQYFPGNITQNNGSSWDLGHGQDHIYLQEIGGVPFGATGHEVVAPFGATGQEIGDPFGAPGDHTNAQYYDQSSYEQMYGSLSMLTGCCLSDQFGEFVQGDTVATGSDGDIDMGLGLAGDGFDPLSVLCDDVPQGCVATEDESSQEALQLQSSPEALQSQDEQTANGDARDQQPPPRCISDFWVGC